MEKKFKRICPRCQKEIFYTTDKIHKQAIKRNSICRSCRTSIANMSPKRDLRGSKHPLWKGIENVPYSWFSSYFERKNKKRTGTVTLEQVFELWKKQDEKCALTGLKIGFNDCGKKGNTCSIDRIDSKKEYTLENIQLVHKDVNLMKNAFDQNYFISICKMIAKKNP